MKILAFLATIVLLNSSCDKMALLEPCSDPYSFNYDPSATGGGEKCNSMGNCLGYTTGFANSGAIGTTLYNAIYDQKMAGEVSILRNFFNGVHANVYILYEPNADLRNAYAISDGRILMGYHMHYYTIQRYGELPVAGILAHEWGHRAQQTFNWRDYYRPEHKELEADAFSGFYMALKKRWSWGTIQSYYANVYAMGDYLFNSPDFHGTPQQRLQAARLGVNTGLYAIQNGIQYTYSELHSIFFETIRNQISGRAQFDIQSEISYPPNLSEDYYKALYPKP